MRNIETNSGISGNVRSGLSLGKTVRAAAKYAVWIDQMARIDKVVIIIARDPESLFHSCRFVNSFTLQSAMTPPHAIRDDFNAVKRNDGVLLDISLDISKWRLHSFVLIHSSVRALFPRCHKRTPKSVFAVHFIDAHRQT
jgi:hypothetical protein